MSKLLWKPSAERVEQANLTRFIGLVNRRHDLCLAGYDELYRWSIAEIPSFWEAVWDFCGLRASARHETVLENPRMPGAKWFRGARLNFAENLLRYRDAQTAMIFVREGGVVQGSVTYAELYGMVARLARFLRDQGVGVGDRVGAFMPNRIETVVGMLATASLGAIWSSCSPDFGFQGVMDRFGQIEPVIFIAPDGYWYNGKTIECLGKVSEIAARMPSLERVVVVPYAGSANDDEGIAAVAVEVPRSVGFQGGGIEGGRGHGGNLPTKC